MSELYISSSISDTSDITDSNDLADSADIHEVSHSKSDHIFSILQFILNCLLHISILFSFLYILFIIIISPLAENGFKSEFSHIIHELINTLLPNKLNLDTFSDSDLDTALSISPQYNTLNPITKLAIRTNLRQISNYVKSNPYIIQNYLKQYSKRNYVLNLHNDNVLIYGQCIIAFTYIITILFCIIFKYQYPTNINLTKLFTENIITFIFIGAGEYWFFTAYAAKFIPAQPSLLSRTAIDTIKSRLSQ